MLALSFLIITCLCLCVSYGKDRAKTKKALKIAARSMAKLLPGLLGMVGLVGLVLALLPPELLGELFQAHGLAGFALISVIGAIVTMPGPVAFPLAGSLLQMGVSLAALAAFITTLMMVGIVTAPMEAAYFGKRFTIIRQSLSFVLALLIGALMGGILQ